MVWYGHAGEVDRLAAFGLEGPPQKGNGYYGKGNWSKISYSGEGVLF